MCIFICIYKGHYIIILNNYVMSNIYLAILLLAFEVTSGLLFCSYKKINYKLIIVNLLIIIN